MFRNLRLAALAKALLLIAAVAVSATYWRVSWDRERAYRIAFLLADEAVPAMCDAFWSRTHLDLRDIWKDHSFAFETYTEQQCTFRCRGLRCSVTNLSDRTPSILVAIGQPYILKHTVLIRKDGGVAIRRTYTPTPIRTSIMQ